MNTQNKPSTVYAVYLSHPAKPGATLFVGQFDTLASAKAAAKHELTPEIKSTGGKVTIDKITMVYK